MCSNPYEYCVAMGMALGLNGAGLFQRIQFSPLISGINSNKYHCSDDLRQYRVVALTLTTQVINFGDGSSILCGQVNGTATFGSTTLTSAGDADVFIAVNADGSYAWAKVLVVLGVTTDGPSAP